MSEAWKIGDKLTVIDRSVAPFPIHGTIIDLDEHPFKESYAMVRVDNSPAFPPPTPWINLRLATRRA